MRVRWSCVIRLCLSVAVWQGSAETAFGGQIAKFTTSEPALEKQFEVESDAVSIEQVGSFPDHT